MNETSGNVENGKVTSTITILTKQLKRAEVNYTASVYFKESERPTEVTATNIPTYTDEWKSPPVKRMHTGWSLDDVSRPSVYHSSVIQFETELQPYREISRCSTHSLVFQFLSSLA